MFPLFDDVKRDPQKSKKHFKVIFKKYFPLASNSTILADINAEFQNISKKYIL